MDQNFEDLILETSYFDPSVGEDGWDLCNTSDSNILEARLGGLVELGVPLVDFAQE